MANRKEWYFGSLILKFLTAPFRAAWTIFIIVLIILCVSTFAQTYFHSPSLLEQEYKQLAHMGTETILHGLDNCKKEQSYSANIRVSQVTYQGLYLLFFKMTRIEKALLAQGSEVMEIKYKQFLITHLSILHSLDDSLKILAIRIGNISIFLFLAIVLTIVAGIDGLVMRKIRQKNASRESAGIYHRAKYWRVGIIWTSILLYLCVPIAVTPYLLMIPIGLGAIMVFLQTMYLKKYL